MKNFSSLCVFCGSRFGNDPAYEQTARELGAVMADKGIRLIYGGGGIGLMGVVANAVMENGGEVIGVMPEFIDEIEGGKLNVTKLVITKNMHERKQKMYDLSQIFIALPGGIGTLEELSEIITWKSLNIKKTSIHLMNINGFYDPLISQFRKMNDNDFLYFDIFKEIIIHDNTNTLEKHLK